MKLLLLSNSVNPDSGYLDHAEKEVREHFGGAERVLFVPFAIHDQEGYTARVRTRLEQLGFQVEGLPDGPGAQEAVAGAEAIFVGGGNTFRLLHRLQENKVVEPIREKVRGGTPYMGSSAGTVITAPTLKTTNDMPIVQPHSFRALGLVPFQINPHYLDADPSSRHMGETRELRLSEYLEENDAPVVGLREGAFLTVTQPGEARMTVSLGGANGARIFQRGTEAVERSAGSCLDDLLLPSQE